MMKQGFILLLTASLMGCVSQGNVIVPPMSVPIQASSELQNKYLQLENILSKNKLTRSERAQILVQQAQYLDTLGIYDISFVKYLQSLEIDKNQSYVYNSLGIYYTLKQEYDMAFEALDTALEIDPSNDFAEFNRALSLYYAERYDLAYSDIQKSFAKQEDDPYRALWLYIIGTEIDPQQALDRMKSIYAENKTSRNWGWTLVGMMIHQVSEDEAIKYVANHTETNLDVAERLSELYFYLAKSKQIAGENVSAVNLYKLALSQNMYEFIEHKYSVVELSRLFQQSRNEQISQ